MGKTFKDMSSVKGYSPKMIAGRGCAKSAGAKDTNLGKGVVRATYEGRHETFLNGSKKK